MDFLRILHANQLLLSTVPFSVIWMSILFFITSKNLARRAGSHSVGNFIVYESVLQIVRRAIKAMPTTTDLFDMGPKSLYGLFFYLFIDWLLNVAAVSYIL